MRGEAEVVRIPSSESTRGEAEVLRMEETNMLRIPTSECTRGEAEVLRFGGGQYGENAYFMQSVRGERLRW